MAKARARYTCSECGMTFAKWTGQCPNCNNWNTLIETMPEAVEGKNALAGARVSGKKLDFVNIKSIVPSDAKERLKTPFKDLDIVLGGGFLKGSVTLLTGQPGIGKSTLLMQICAHIAKSHNVLYISGEESAGQVKLRAVRLGAESDKLSFASSTSGNDIAMTSSKKNCSFRVASGFLDCCML